MITKKLITLYSIFLISCNNRETNKSNNSETEKAARVNNSSQIWKKNIISNYNQQFPDIYPYYIKWSKLDSIITYSVLSKNKDTLIPKEIEHLKIENRKTSIDIDFVNKRYVENLPDFSVDFSGIDKNKVDDIYVSNDSLFLKRNSKERKKHRDSMINILFK